MSNENKKYKFIDSIGDDAPHGNINYYTMSFLTPDKYEKTSGLNVCGFKVYNGYTIEDLAKDDIKLIKQKNPNFDIFMASMGKLYPWDDDEKSEKIQYDDAKLNDLESTRKENMDKAKLLMEQFQNEKNKLNINNETKKAEIIRRRLQEKLHKRGDLSKRELDELQSSNSKYDKNKNKDISDLLNNIKEASSTDYLDETPVPNGGLKYGCISIFTPATVKNIKNIYFKVRGLYTNKTDLIKRINELTKLHPLDKIMTFEVGKWTAYSDDVYNGITESEGQFIVDKLNYAMKCYLDNVNSDKDNFDKRKDEMISKNKEDSIKSKISRNKRRADKRKENKRKSAMENNENIKNILDKSDGEISHLALDDNEDDEKAIQELANYLNDPELKGKYTANPDDLETVIV